MNNNNLQQWHNMIKSSLTLNAKCKVVQHQRPMGFGTYLVTITKLNDFFIDRINIYFIDLKIMVQLLIKNLSKSESTWSLHYCTVRGTVYKSIINSTYLPLKIIRKEGFIYGEARLYSIFNITIKSHKSSIVSFTLIHLL